eukprot:8657552-Ditylum_brightwellii.AAC.1
MKDDVCAFIGVAANVKTKHYRILGVSSKISKKLNVSSTTIKKTLWYCLDWVGSVMQWCCTGEV